MPVRLTPALEAEYQHLFDTCLIRPERAALVNSLVTKIESNRNRYATVGDPLGIPWYFIGIVHNMEASLNFGTHLHNGDSLLRRTKQVPAGRPKTGNPPFTWEESATDALKLEGLDQVTNWSLPGILFRFEAYNGFGYRMRHPEILSPYLWSFSNHYTRGKFVADGTFSSTAVSQQCGAAILLRRMAETGVIQFNSDGVPLHSTVETTEGTNSLASFEPLVRFSNTKRSDMGEELQRALNKFPGIFVKVDGKPGTKTSDAFKRLTGHFLMGDPRA
ncbi:MAG TPA: hypothetical protein VGB17_00975 [Pyrinomonadaceae bacterium]|jgi:lysozyme family protein